MEFSKFFRLSPYVFVIAIWSFSDWRYFPIYKITKNFWHRNRIYSEKLWVSLYIWFSVYLRSNTHLIKWYIGHFKDVCLRWFRILLLCIGLVKRRKSTQLKISNGWQLFQIHLLLLAAIFFQSTLQFTNITDNQDSYGCL